MRTVSYVEYLLLAILKSKLNLEKVELAKEAEAIFGIGNFSTFKLSS